MSIERNDELSKLNTLVPILERELETIHKNLTPVFGAALKDSEKIFGQVKPTLSKGAGFRYLPSEALAEEGGGRVEIKTIYTLAPYKGGKNMVFETKNSRYRLEVDLEAGEFVVTKLAKKEGRPASMETGQVFRGTGISLTGGRLHLEGKNGLVTSPLESFKI